MVFFESPHRVAESLADLAAALGADRPAAVCRELTKTYEEVIRGPLAELCDWAAGDVRGEITLVVAGRPDRPAELSPAELAARVSAREQAGQSRKDAIAEVAATTGLAKRLVFDAVVSAKRDG
jgi:16S rRNA (cytidine1402-2'-O)-methyltransferase